jgi:hypothetical protein
LHDRRRQILWPDQSPHAWRVILPVAESGLAGQYVRRGLRKDTGTDKGGKRYCGNAYCP